MNAAHELLAAFVTDRGLTDIAPDSDGRIGLKVDGNTQVDLKAKGDRLYVYASLGLVPPADEETVLVVLLAANRGGSLGEGPVMSLDPQLGDIVMSQEIDARGAGSAIVLRAIGAIAEQVDVWRRRLDEIGVRMNGRSPQESPPDRLNFLMIRG